MSKSLASYSTKREKSLAIQRRLQEKKGGLGFLAALDAAVKNQALSQGEAWIAIQEAKKRRK